MQELLKQNNVVLLHEIEKLQRSLMEVRDDVPEELKAYTQWVSEECGNLRNAVFLNLRYLESGHPDLLKDILSETQKVSRYFYVFNERFTSPILRARESDRLSLKLLLWLHATHPKTTDIPVAVCDGEFSIWLIEPNIPNIYFTPCAAQQGLLNLPLFFHEFGHLLYRCHQREMNELVSELQEEISNLLAPAVVTNDRYTEAQEKKRMSIVETWYTWAQEIFCDAVGFVIGGASFTYAFSTYFRMLDRSEYHVEEPAHRSHPVTWIRIRLLADRARQMGYEVVATDLEDEWDRVASVLGVDENYYGFYDQAFLPIIQRKLNDMLTETAPREFHKSEVAGRELKSTITSPVELLNGAWQKFWNDPDCYQEWEKCAMTRFLDSDI